MNKEWGSSLPAGRTWGRPRPRAGEALYAFRIPGGRREVQSGERAGEGETMMFPYAGLAPKKATDPRRADGTSDGMNAGRRETMANATKTDVPDRPEPGHCRGKCPRCGCDVVCNSYYVGAQGAALRRPLIGHYDIFWECWESLGADPACDYRKLL